MNFESLLLKELPPNGMTKPLNAIIGVANFSVNFHLQRKKGCSLRQNHSQGGLFKGIKNGAKLGAGLSNWKVEHPVFSRAAKLVSRIGGF